MPCPCLWICCASGSWLPWQQVPPAIAPQPASRSAGRAPAAGRSTSAKRANSPPSPVTGLVEDFI